MERALMSSLVEWKRERKRKPLLLRGARQVGKTWLLKEFGVRHFARCAYIRFDKSRAMQEVFSRESDVRRLLTAIQLEVGFKPVPGETLIVLDEIQEAPGALTSLKYFCEELPEYAIAAAGSQLGISDRQGTGFPVGKVDTLFLHPLSFLEFLRAIGQDGFAEMLQEGDWGLIGSFRERLTDWLRHYYFIGGMPEIVADYAANGDFQRVRRLQRNLLQDYRDDFGKHAPPEAVRRIELLWDAIPRQLAKENKKYVYKEVQPRMRGEDVLSGMQWLVSGGLVRLARKASKPGVPLSAYANGGFKAFMVDVGLLAAVAGVQARTLLEGSRIFEEFKGALAEQFVQQELAAYFGTVPFYWSSDTSSNEVDFLIESDGAVIPVETKSGVNARAKSLRAYCEKYRPPMAVRASLVKYYRQAMPLNGMGGAPASYELLDLPLYALCRLMAECGGTAGE